MSAVWPDPVESVAAFLRAAGAEARLEQYAGSLESAEAAADVIGCTLGQIVEARVLDCDDALHVVLVSADRQVDTGKVARVTGARRVRMATSAEVTAATGFDPGSMAPFPPGRVESVIVDRAILRRSTVWVGGGSLRHRVALTPLELVRLTRGRVEPVGLESA